MFKLDNGLNNFVEDDKLQILPCQGPARAERAELCCLVSEGELGAFQQSEAS